jgi:hypothetical protein
MSEDGEAVVAEASARQAQVSFIAFWQCKYLPCNVFVISGLVLALD